METILVAAFVFVITAFGAAAVARRDEEQVWHDAIYDILDDLAGDHEGPRGRMLLLFAREFRRIVNEMEATKNGGNS